MCPVVSSGCARGAGGRGWGRPLGERAQAAGGHVGAEPAPGVAGEALGLRVRAIGRAEARSASPAPAPRADRLPLNALKFTKTPLNTLYKFFARV